MDRKEGKKKKKVNSYSLLKRGVCDECKTEGKRIEQFGKVQMYTCDNCHIDWGVGI